MSPLSPPQKLDRGKLEIRSLLSPPQKLDRGKLEIRSLLQPSLDRLLCKFLRREIPQRAMRPMLIVVDPPCFNFRPSLLDRLKT